MKATTTERMVGPAGLGVSWGALFGGAVFILAVTTLLWLLGLAITLGTMHAAEVRGASLALVLTMIGATLVGAAVGGYLSGWLQGSGLRRLGGIHGLLACALAFLVATGFSMMLAASALRGAGSLVATTAQTAASATAQAAGGAAAGGGNVASGAERLLEGLGYSPAESRVMVQDAQRSIQSVLRRNNLPSGSEVSAAAEQAGTSLIRYLGGVVWVYWGTWLVAMLLAFGLGALGARRPIVEERQMLRQPTPTPPLGSPEPSGA